MCQCLCNTVSKIRALPRISLILKEGAQYFARGAGVSESTKLQGNRVTKQEKKEGRKKMRREGHMKERRRAEKRKRLGVKKRSRRKGKPLLQKQTSFGRLTCYNVYKVRDSWSLDPLPPWSILKAF